MSCDSHTFLLKGAKGRSIPPEKDLTQKLEVTKNVSNRGEVMLEKLHKNISRSGNPILDFQMDFLEQSVEAEGNDVTSDLKATDVDDDVSHFANEIMLECSSASFSDDDENETLATFGANKKGSSGVNVFSDLNNRESPTEENDEMSVPGMDHPGLTLNCGDSLKGIHYELPAEGENFLSFSPLSEQGYSELFSFFQNEVFKPTVNCWRPVSDPATPHQYFRYGNETWVATDTNVGSSKNQPNQTILVPAQPELNPAGWNPSERSEGDKFDFLSFLNDCSRASFNDKPIASDTSPEMLNHLTASTSKPTTKHNRDNSFSICSIFESIQDSSFPSMPNNLSNQREIDQQFFKTVGPPEMPSPEVNNFPQCSFNPPHLGSSSFISQIYDKNFSVEAFLRCHGRSLAKTYSLTYEDHVNSLPNHVSPNDVFCMVPGRLGSPYYGKKHVVTVGEIIRRILTPESLNISLLGPILRKAKSKNGSVYLRQKLHEIGVDLPQGRRKTAQCTLFTSLTESEAGQLAQDYWKICERKFPARKLAEKAHNQWVARAPPNDESTTVLFKNIVFLIDVCIDLCSQSSNNLVGCRDEMEKCLFELDALTHGFGLKCFICSLKLFRAFVSSLLELTS